MYFKDLKKGQIASIEGLGSFVVLSIGDTFIKVKYLDNNREYTYPLMDWHGNLVGGDDLKLDHTSLFYTQLRDLK